MYRTRGRALRRTSVLAVMAIVAVSTLLMMSYPAHAQAEDCYLVADKGDFPGDRDLLTHISMERGSTDPIAETTVGFTGTFGIESLASTGSDPSFTLWGVDKNRLGTIDKATGTFTGKPATFGSGNGALGTKNLSNVDATAFVGDRLFGTHRSEDDPDLLFEIDENTGQRVKDAFGPGVDYLVMPAPGGRHNVDALVATNGTMLGILNKRGGVDSVLAEIDPNTAAVTVIGSTSPADDVEGMALGTHGLWYINGKDLDGTGRKTFVWEANLATGAGSNPRAIGLDNGARDYEGMTCRQGTPPPPVPNIIKFHDLNANGQRDQGEPGIADWEFHVTGPNGYHEHFRTEIDGSLALLGLAAGQYKVCETLPEGWLQTAPSAGADCTDHVHDGINPGPRGYEFGATDEVLLEFGNTSCVRDKLSSNARAYGIRANLLGGGLLAADPDIGPTPDSNVMNPDSLLSIPNILDPTKPPLVTLLGVSEQEDATSATATATTGAVDIAIPGLDALRVQADAIQARSRSYAESGGASSSSTGSTIVNLRIGGVQYGDVSEPLSVVIDDPLNPGTPFIEVHVLERIRRHAAAGIPQPQGGQYRSGLDVNAIHVVVHDLTLTTFLDESTDIIVAHASTDIAFSVNINCPSVSGAAFAAKLFNVSPDLADAVAGHVLLPSTGGSESKALADVDVGTILTADAASTSTEGAITSLSPDAAEASSKAVITDANIAGLITARVVEATANAKCDSPVNALQSCSNSTIGGNAVIADVNILGVDVCAVLLLENTCEPAPNTELLHIPGIIRVVLNEQVADPDGRGITVNAIHIWVLDALPNPLLPVGAEVIISSAHADTHPRLP